MKRLAGRLWDAAGTLLARDTVVVTNAIAFNFLLCLFPMLLVTVAALQQLPARKVTAGLLLVLNELIPFERTAMAQAVETLGRSARRFELLALVLIVWASSGIFVPVEMALNRAWGGRPRPFWRSRMLAFVMTAGGGLLAFASVALTVLARSYHAQWPALAEYGSKLSALAMTYAMFFLIYRFVPDPAVDTGTAFKAALVAGTAWEAAKYLFVVNLARANLRVMYGPLAFAVSLVLWAYFSSLVLVLGALLVKPGRASRGDRAGRGGRG